MLLSMLLRVLDSEFTLELLEVDEMFKKLIRTFTYFGALFGSFSSISEDG